MSLPGAGMGQIKRHLVLCQGMGDSLWPLFYGAEAGGACWGACCLPTAVCTEQGQPRAPASDSPPGSSYPDRRQKMPRPANSCLRPKRLSGGVRVNLLLWLFLLVSVPWALVPLPCGQHRSPRRGISNLKSCGLPQRAIYWPLQQLMNRKGSTRCALRAVLWLPLPCNREIAQQEPTPQPELASREESCWVLCS